MILDNYWKWRNTMGNFVRTMNANESTTMKDTSGSSVSIASYIYSNASFSPNQADIFVKNFKLNVDVDLQFDSGTGEPESDIYTMPNQIVGITKTSLSATYSAGSEGGKMTISYAGTNNAGESITITRVGIMKGIRYLSSTTDSTGTVKQVLMGYVVLSEPLTVPNGMGFTINVEWDES